MTRSPFRFEDIDDDTGDRLTRDEYDDLDADDEETGDDNDPDPDADFQGLMNG